jgi:hypothetical protein
MGFFDNVRNSINSAANTATARLNNLNRENSNLKSEKQRLSSKYNQVTRSNSILRNKNNELNVKVNLIQGKLIDSTNKAKIVASDRFGELKSQYLKKVELIDTQEELLTKQNKSIRESEDLIKNNNKNMLNNTASASTHAREVLYNNKDLVFYNTVSNILKFILLGISIAVIYLLMKK